MKKTLVAMMMAGAALVAVPAAGQKADDTNRLIDQGMNHSQVMTIAQEMTDGLGPRLTNSPGMRRAEQWAIDKFNGWGLANVHRDGFEFGRGMSDDRRVGKECVRTVSSRWSPYL